MALSDFLASQAGAASAPKQRLILTPAPTAKAQAQAGPKPQSLGDQAGGLVKGLLPGLFHLGKEIVTSLPGMSNDPLSGRNLVKTATAVQAAHDNGQGVLGSAGAGIRATGPVAADMGASFKRTGGRLVDLGSVPFGNQTLAGSQYGQAVKHGTILPTIVEDAGNISMVGGLATKGLTAGASRAAGEVAAKEAAGASAAELAQASARAAKLEGAASTAERLFRPAHLVGNAPALPFELAGKGIAKVAAPIADAIKGTEWGQAQAARIGEFKANQAEKAGLRELDQTAKRAAGEEARRGGLAGQAVTKATRGLAKELGVDAADLTHARNMHLAGLTPVLEVIDQLDERQKPAALHAVFGVEQAPTPGAIKLALNPEAMSRAREAYTPIQGMLDRAEQMKLDKGLLSEEQLGRAPMESSVQRILEPVDYKNEQIRKLLEQKVGSADRAAELLDRTRGYETVKPKRTAVTARSIGKAEIKGITDERLAKRETVLDSQMLEDAKRAGKLGETKGVRSERTNVADRAAAKVARQLDRNLTAREQLAERLATGTAEVAPGAYKPALIGGERLNAALKLMGREDLAQLPTSMTGLHDSGIEPLYQPGGFENPTFKPGIGAARNIQERTLISARQKKGGNILKSDARIAEQTTRDLATMAQNEGITQIKAQYVRTPADLIKEKIAELDAKGDSITRDEQLLRADLEDRVLRGHDLGAFMRDQGYSSISNKAETAIKPDSEFVPKSVLSEYKRLVAPADKGGFAKVFDKGTTIWKHGQLALNPAWQVGNTVGNATMAMIRGGMSPGDLGDYAAKARRVLEQEATSGESILPARIHGTGGVAEMIRQMATGQEPKTAVGRLVNKSYGLNEMVDNTGKAAYYMWLKDKGLSDEAAVQQTLRVMGDFSNLSPMEQSIKRIFPFYAWQRHAARMGYDMLTKRPGATAAWLDVSQQHRGNPADPANSVRNDDPRAAMLHLGTNLFLPMGNMNPFNSSIQTPFLSPGQAAGSLNPIIKAGAAMGLGLNLNRQREMTKPGGATGKLGPMSAGADVNYLAQQTGPIGRAVLGAWGGTPSLLPSKSVVRYDTGQVMTSKGKILPQEGGRLQATTRPLGLPIPVFMNESRVTKSMADKAAQARREAQLKAKKKKAKKG